MAISPAVKDLVDALAEIAAATLTREAEHLCKPSNSIKAHTQPTPVPAACRKQRPAANRESLSMPVIQQTASGKPR